MKTMLLTLFFGLSCCATLSGQIKIGDNPQNIDGTSLLELESGTRALVITRINTAQMDAMVPLQGAVIYNTDTQCLHYYSGTGWINICEALGEQRTFTANAVVNPFPTIVITETTDNLNFEVGRITGGNIQAGSITQNNLAPNSVGRDQLVDNAITPAEIDLSVVTLNTFTNDAGFITGPVVSNDPGNAITDNGGAFYDDSAIQSGISTNAANIATNTTDIVNNTNAIAAHIAADGDTNATNELLTSVLVQGNNLVLNEGTNQRTVSLAVFNQTLGIAGNLLSISGGNSVPLPVSDGTDTKLNPGTNITVTGNGTSATPYIISANAEVDGSVTNEIQTLSSPDGSVVITPTGPTNTDYFLTVLPSAAANGAETIIDATASTIGVTGVGTLANPYVLTGVSVNPIAADVAFTPYATLTSTDTQTAIQELKDEVDAIPVANGAETIIDATASTIGVTGAGTAADPYILTGGGNPAAADVSFVPTGNTVSPDVQAAIEELQMEIDGITSTGTNPNDELITNFALTGTSLNIAEGTNIVPPVDLDAVFATDAALTALSVDDADADPANEIQDLSLIVNSLTITNNPTATTIDLATYLDNTDNQNAVNVPYTNTTSGLIADNVQTAIDELAATGDSDSQALNVTNTLFDSASGILTIALQNSPNATADLNALATDAELGTAIAASEALDLDKSIANEIQTITSTDGSVTLTQTGNDYDLSVAGVGTDDQNLESAILVGTDLTIAIEGGTSTVADLSPLTTDIELAAAIAASEALDLDKSIANEIQTITSTDGSVTLTQTGNDYDLSVAGVGTDDQNLESAILVGTDLTIAIEGGTSTVADLSPLTTDIELAAAIAASEALDLDKSIANEIQTITSTDGSVTLTQTGNDYDLSVAGVGTDNQNLSILGNDLSISGGNTVTLPVASIDAIASTIGVTGTGTAVDPYILASVNLSNKDLTQTLGENRTYDLNGQNLTFAGSGNIAIGSISPQDKLDVDGQIRARNGFAATEGSVGNPGYGFFTNGDTNTGMFRIAEDQLGFTTGGTEAIRIIANQNVGVGTTTPTSTLHTGGSFATAIFTTSGNLALNDTHHTIILGGNHDITLPPAATFVGRIYIIKNTTGATPTIDSYIDSLGVPTINIPAGVIHLQSDGTDWQQIN